MGKANKTSPKTSARHRAAEGGDGQRPVTVSQIAEEIGLAASTVSLILNGHGPRLKIAARTVERVFELAREKKYVPNDLARSLRARRTFVIGVVFGNLYNGWAQKVLEGMLDVFDGEGYIPFMTIHNWDEGREAREINSLIQRRVDGIIAVPILAGIKTYQEIRQRGLPLVLLGDTFPELQDFSYIGWNSGQAAEVIMKHLVAIGRRRIGFIGAEHPTIGTMARFDAYRNALRRHHLPFREEWVGMHATLPSATTMVSNMLDQIFRPGQEHPDALFVLNDGLALPTLGLLEERGFRVPEDVALTGMGNMPGVSHPRIGLTTVAEPLEEMGRLTARSILQLVDKPGSQPIRQLVESNQLLPRASTMGLQSASGQPHGWQMG